MPKPFYERLRQYYEDLAAVLRDEARVASMLPNSSDVGGSREKVYAEFLRQHAPSKCNVFFGGFLFDLEGNESRQMDVVVTTDTTPQFNFLNRDGSGKAFAPVEGTVAVAAIKSSLDKAQLEDALLGIASIPEMQSLRGRISRTYWISNYEDWPHKIIYASDGIAGKTLKSHIDAFYVQHPEIPIHRRPDLIHVVGKYAIKRVTEKTALLGSDGAAAGAELNSFVLLDTYPDVQAIMMALDHLQQYVSASSHIVFFYGEIVNKVSDVLRQEYLESIDSP